MNNDSYYHEVKRQLDVMRALYDISVEISTRLETQKVVTSIVKHATKLLGASGSTLAICEPETNLAHIVALYNVPYTYEELILKPGASIASQVLVTGKPVIINDINDWKKDNRFSGGHKSTEAYNSILSVPLTWDGKISGALTVMGREDRMSFNKNDSQLLSLLANLASAAINNADLLSKVIQLNQQLEQKVEERTSELNRARDELKKLHAETVFLQEDERSRISRDLHDGTNQLISGTLYEIQAAESSIKNGHASQALERLDTAKSVLRQIDVENRRIISGLRPLALDTHGIFDAIKKLVEAYNNLNEAHCEFHIRGDLIRLESQVEISIYRIVQESLKNAYNHSRATSVKIIFEISRKELNVEISDNGTGFRMDQVDAGERLGLIGMRERAQIIGGNVTLESKSGEGTKISLFLPLNSDIIRSGNGHGEKKKKNRNTLRRDENKMASGDDKKPQVLVFDISEAIEELDEENVLLLVKKAIAHGISPVEILQMGIMEGLKAIGSKLDEKVYSISELLIATKMAENCISHISPYLPEGRGGKRGVVVFLSRASLIKAYAFSSSNSNIAFEISFTSIYITLLRMD